MDAAYDPAAWHDFGVALVGATAALLGQSVAAGIILGVLCSMLAIWSLFVGLGLELEG